MRGRQQVYLTIGCAPNWPGLALNPRRNMPILGEKEWAAGVGAVGLCPAVGRTAGHVQVAGMGSVGHAHSWREGVGILGLCPALKWAAGHVQPREWAVWGMPIFGGKEWAFWGYVQPSSGPRGMSRGGAAGRGGEAQLGEAGKFRYSSICF